MEAADEDHAEIGAEETDELVSHLIDYVGDLAILP
jgi:hypothetical protein